MKEGDGFGGPETTGDDPWEAKRVYVRFRRPTGM